MATAEHTVEEATPSTLTTSGASTNSALRVQLSPAIPEDGLSQFYVQILTPQNMPTALDLMASPSMVTVTHERVQHSPARSSRTLSLVTVKFHREPAATLKAWDMEPDTELTFQVLQVNGRSVGGCPWVRFVRPETLRLVTQAGRQEESSDSACRLGPIEHDHYPHLFKLCGVCGQLHLTISDCRDGQEARMCEVCSVDHGWVDGSTDESVPPVCRTLVMDYTEQRVVGAWCDRCEAFAWRLPRDPLLLECSSCKRYFDGNRFRASGFDIIEVRPPEGRAGDLVTLTIEYSGRCFLSPFLIAFDGTTTNYVDDPGDDEAGNPSVQVIHCEVPLLRSTETFRHVEVRVVRDDEDALPSLERSNRSGPARIYANALSPPAIFTYYGPEAFIFRSTRQVRQQLEDAFGAGAGAELFEVFSYLHHVLSGSDKDIEPPSSAAAASYETILRGFWSADRWDDFTRRFDELGIPVLHTMVMIPHALPLVRFLVEEVGADVDGPDRNGNTALHYAVKWLHDRAVILYLIAAGADATAPNSQGESPASMAPSGVAPYLVLQPHEARAELDRELARLARVEAAEPAAGKSLDDDDDGSGDGNNVDSSEAPRSGVGGGRRSGSAKPDLESVAVMNQLLARYEEWSARVGGDIPVSEDLLDPISRFILFDPVIAADGHTYSRLTIEHHFKQAATSPLTNEPLESLALRPNIEMRNRLAMFSSLAEKKHLEWQKMLSRAAAKERMVSVDVGHHGFGAGTSGAAGDDGGVLAAANRTVSALKCNIYVVTKPEEAAGNAMTRSVSLNEGLAGADLGSDAASSHSPSATLDEAVDRLQALMGDALDDIMSGVSGSEGGGGSSSSAGGVSLDDDVDTVRQGLQVFLLLLGLFQEKEHETVPKAEEISFFARTASGVAARLDRAGRFADLIALFQTLVRSPGQLVVAVLEDFIARGERLVASGMPAVAASIFSIAEHACLRICGPTRSKSNAAPEILRLLSRSLVGLAHSAQHDGTVSADGSPVSSYERWALSHGGGLSTRRSSRRSSLDSSHSPLQVAVASPLESVSEYALPPPASPAVSVAGSAAGGGGSSPANVAGGLRSFGHYAKVAALYAHALRLETREETQTQMRTAIISNEVDFLLAHTEAFRPSKARARSAASAEARMKTARKMLALGDFLMMGTRFRRAMDMYHAAWVALRSLTSAANGADGGAAALDTHIVALDRYVDALACALGRSQFDLYRFPLPWSNHRRHLDGIRERMAEAVADMTAAAEAAAVVAAEGGGDRTCGNGSASDDDDYDDDKPLGRRTGAAGGSAFASSGILSGSRGHGQVPMAGGNDGGGDQEGEEADAGEGLLLSGRSIQSAIAHEWANVTQRMLADILEMLPRPPYGAEFAVVSLGGLTTRNVSFYSPLEFAVVYEDWGDVHHAYHPHHPHRHHNRGGGAAPSSEAEYHAAVTAYLAGVVGFLALRVIALGESAHRHGAAFYEPGFRFEGLTPVTDRRLIATPAALASTVLSIAPSKAISAGLLAGTARSEHLFGAFRGELAADVEQHRGHLALAVLASAVNADTSPSPLLTPGDGHVRSISRVVTGPASGLIRALATAFGVEADAGVTYTFLSDRILLRALVARGCISVWLAHRLASALELGASLTNSAHLFYGFDNDAVAVTGPDGRGQESASSHRFRPHPAIAAKTRDRIEATVEPIHQTAADFAAHLRARINEVDGVNPPALLDTSRFLNAQVASALRSLGTGAVSLRGAVSGRLRVGAAVDGALQASMAAREAGVAVGALEVVHSPRASGEQYAVALFAESLFPDSGFAPLVDVLFSSEGTDLAKGRGVYQVNLPGGGSGLGTAATPLADLLAAADDDGAAASRLSAWDSGQFSELAVLSMLLRTGRAGPERYMVVDGECGSVRVVAREARGISTDAVLRQTFQTEDAVPAAVLFCFDAMNEPVDRGVVHHLLALDARSLLEGWLLAMNRFNAGLVAAAGDAAAVEAYANHGHGLLPFYVTALAVRRLYRKLTLVQEVLAANPAVTHLALLGKVDQSQAEHYGALLRQPRLSPLQRFEAVQAARSPNGGEASGDEHGGSGTDLPRVGSSGSLSQNGSLATTRHQLTASFSPARALVEVFGGGGGGGSSSGSNGADGAD